MSESDTRMSMFGRLHKDPRDPATWKEIVGRYGSRIFGWAKARGMRAADCEDVTQQVFIRLAGVLRTFEYDLEKGRFRDYLRRVTETAVIDYVRKARSASALGRSGDGLDSQEARADLTRRLEAEYDLELFEIACTRVRARVGEAVWRRFALVLPAGLGGSGQSIEEAAAEVGGRPGLIYQARFKVVPLLREEVGQLGGRDLLA